MLFSCQYVSDFATDYEILNKPVRVSRELNASAQVVEEFEYDASRNRIRHVKGEATGGDADPGTPGAQPANTIDFEYDERDLLFREIHAKNDAAQSTVQYDYDGNSNLVARRHGLEDTLRVTTFEYDGYDRLVRQTDPMGNTVEREYDDAV